MLPVFIFLTLGGDDAVVADIGMLLSLLVLVLPLLVLLER